MRIEPRYWLALAALLTAQPKLRAQQIPSCPDADTALASLPVPKKLRMGYDKMTDTTTVVAGWYAHVPMSGDPAQITLIGYAEGQKVPLHLEPVLQVIFQQQGEGGALVGRTNGQQMTKENAKYGDVDVARLLLDDSIRVALKRVGYQVKLNKAGVMLPERLEETARFALEPSDLIAIAHSAKVVGRFGDNSINMKHSLADGANILARFALCTTPVAAPAPANP